jgi:hypothetical protein
VRRYGRGSKAIAADGNIEIASTGDNAINLIANLQLSPDPHRETPPIPMHLPPRSAGFIGRQRELATLIEFLDPVLGSKTDAISVTGPPGVGKTALVANAGHEARERNWFPGGVFFIDLRGYDDAPIEPLHALGVLLQGLGYAPERIPPDLNERSRLYQSVLAGSSAPSLIVADNAASEAQVRPLLPNAGPHRMLITSRLTLAGLAAQIVDIEVLSSSAATQVLDAAVRVGRPGDQRIALDDAGALLLATACGGLPLALQIVGALLRADPARTVKDLADELTNERDRLERLRYDDGSGLAAPSVESAFSLSYRRLEAASASVFQVLPLNPGPDVAPSAVAALADLPVALARKLLGDLAAAHLVETVSPERWRMHDLLRLYAAKVAESYMTPDKKVAARKRLLAFYLDHALAAAEHMGLQVEGPNPVDFASREKAVEWLEGERLNLVAMTKAAAQRGLDEYAYMLASAIGKFLVTARRFDEWL